ncbi:hypothetical protein CE195_05970 [Sodalis-like symbiont of Philaenus spumarius]|nr:hypothetical protein CE195_05970 [Sodalis-like symbiont of Philaenus spumarius]
MITVSVHCPRCHADGIYRNGPSPTTRSGAICARSSAG